MSLVSEENLQRILVMFIILVIIFVGRALTSGASSTDIAPTATPIVKNTIYPVGGLIRTYNNNYPGGGLAGTLKNNVYSCSDGSSPETCSAIKPIYCDSSGNLISNCGVCGCESGYTCSAYGICQLASPPVPSIAPIQNFDPSSYCGKIQPNAVRDVAVSIARGEPGAYNIGQVLLLYDWMKQNIAYVSDPSSGNYVATASETYDLRAGNCENQAILVSSLIRAIGGTTKLVASNQCAHAFAAVYIGSQQNLDDLEKIIQQHYGYSNAGQFSTLSDSSRSKNWLIVDPAGGRYLGDLLPECSGVSDLKTINDC